MSTIDDGHNPHCLGCGSANDASVKFQVSRWGEREVHGTVAFGDVHQGAPGRVHGGAIATALDEVLGRLALRHFGEDVLTVRLELSFEAPGQVPDALPISARIDEAEGRKAWLSGTLGAAPPLATARALFIRARPLADDERPAA